MALKLYSVKVAGVEHHVQANSLDEAKRFGTDAKEITPAAVSAAGTKAAKEVANKAAAPSGDKA